MSIYDFLRPFKNFNRYSGEYGIEIETETAKPYDLPIFTFWRVVDDGSLRHFGKEYILSQPVKFHKELDAALKEFETKTAGIKFLEDQPTTSVHVHVNMLNESWKTMGNFLTLYTLFENLLIRFSGEDRRSNLFCLPIVDAEDTYKNIVGMFTAVENKNIKQCFYQENAVKYAALNLASFGLHGSVELRSMRGVTDIRIIKQWLDIINKMLEFSRGSITPPDIMLRLKNKGTKIIDEVFGDLANLIHHKEEQHLLDKNLWYASSVAYSVKRGWNELDIDAKDKYVPKQKELEQYAMKLFGRAFGDLDPAQAEYVIAMASKDFYAKKANKKGEWYAGEEDQRIGQIAPERRDRLMANGDAVHFGNLDAIADARNNLRRAAQPAHQIIEELPMENNEVQWNQLGAFGAAPAAGIQPVAAPAPARHVQDAAGGRAIHDFINGLQAREGRDR